MKSLCLLLGAILLTTMPLAIEPLAAEQVTFNARTARSGPWSAAETWEASRLPQSGDFVQVRAGHVVTYDVDSSAALRMIHVAGTLSFARDKSTLLVVGLIRIEPGETSTEDGFDCQAEVSAHDAGGSTPALEIGTPDSPIPAEVKATIRLKHFPGTSEETLPAIIVCGGRWDVHGAPLVRTWVKLGAPAMPGDSQIIPAEEMKDWRAGDRIIITSGEAQGPESGHSFQKKPFGRQKPVGTEDRTIAAGGAQTAGAVIRLDRPLDRLHCGEDLMRCEVGNLSRNVVIESADPAGVRGHTMYHHGSLGGISYAEFRHLGKEGVLGKYAIHFHLVRDTMRGSGVTGASIWDSHNRWITIHGTDHLLVRDCVGYQSRGHGFFLEDATEQWNVLDRNLAVQAFNSTPLPRQVLPYDPNDGAGFWWANGRNTFTRNVSCENDHYGYHFQISETPDFDAFLRLREPDGQDADRDVRTVPLLRFEDNESHGDGLFGFRLGDESHGAVHGDRAHPFIARNLRVWAAHYAIRPNVQFFLLDGLRVQNAAFGIYHPDYAAHVYRDISFENVTQEPLNGGHDEDSVPYGDVSFDRLSFTNCYLDRDPLVQLTGIAREPGLVGHFRGLMLHGSSSKAGVINFGGGPRTRKTEHAISYFFHDLPAAGAVIQVKSAQAPLDGEQREHALDDLLGVAVRAVAAQGIAFPEILAPIDDLPPTTMITHMMPAGMQRIVRGIAHDNGEIAGVMVNGQSATINAQQAGVADWSITLDPPADGKITAHATDRAGNIEQMRHEIGAVHHQAATHHP